MRSLLLMPAFAASLMLALAGLAMMAMAGDRALAWAGVVLAAGPFPAFILLLMARGRIARTKPRMPLAMSVSLSGSSIAVLGALFTPAGPVPLLCALAGSGLFLWYNFVYSRFPGRASRAVRVGDALPAFTLEQPDGTPVPSDSFQGRKTLFLFYRGNWCPLCMAQIREVAAEYGRLDAAGVTVALVSPQPPAETVRLAERFDVPFRFLVDRDLQAARALDIFADGGTPAGLGGKYGRDTVLPTVLATDETGRVIYLDQTDNYRVRPEPETFLAIVSPAQPAAA